MTSIPLAASPVDLGTVRALMISHVDNAGVSRLKVVPGRKIESAARSGSTVSLSVALLLAIDDHVCRTDELDSTVGDLRGIPDLGAVAMIDPIAGLAWAPSDLHTLDGTPHPACSRSLLKRLGREAEADGLDFTIGLEMEFTLFTGSADAPVLAHFGPGYGVRPFLELEAWHLDVLRGLEQAGVPIEQLHPEFGAGQVEVSFAPRDPVRAVDDYLLARHVITRHSAAHGLLVSFQPVASTATSSNGCHIHFSARRDGVNVFHDPAGSWGVSDEGGHMIAGVLAHMPESVALLGGSTLSFERLQPHNWSGAVICWGVGNREVAVRLMPGYAGLEATQSNVEVKCADPAANLYLAVATVIASALDGVRTEAPLPEPVNVDPELLTDAERAAVGVTPFPADLSEALDLLEKSAFVREAFGSMLLDAYVAVRRHDAATYGALPVDEAVALTRWKL
ncbi:glutamine synthetase family protein [Cryobacterium tagatosivorans]|uniref:Glutamine synthetase n=1 Tax=Cryobacterium tagatosivorans TaxID=1259199 RepID=A0A4R8UGE8_9MICO|nr:glutamine synthetase family protein [Cryobacterium tagatosivorans]TFB52437.1 glutamine synthetase [Cryobacterium tagatosivorans]